MTQLIKIPSSKLIIKSEAERLVYGEVYVPYRLDVQDEYMKPEEIRKACHKFMKLGGPDMVDSNHNQFRAGCSIVENYLAKANDPDGYYEGSWVAGGHVHNDATWEKVIKGELNGWSMMGHAFKREQTARIQAVRAIRGATEPSTHPTIPPHYHSYLVKFDQTGKVVPCVTGDAVYTDRKGPAHAHGVDRTTATMQEHDHAHRWDINWTAKDDNVELEEREQTVREIYDAKPKWLSLVQYAAVRRPFKIIKGDSAMDRVIQAILVEKGQKIEDAIVGVEELEGLSPDEIQPLKIYNVGQWSKHVLVAKADFDPESLHEITPKDGVRIVVGETREGLDVDGISLGRKDKPKVFVAGIKKNEEGNSMAFTDEQKTEVKDMIAAALKDELGAFKSDVVEILKGSTVEGTVEDTEEKKTEEKVVEKSGDTGIDDLKTQMSALKEMLGEVISKSDEQKKELEKFINSGTSTPGAATTTDEEEEIEKSDTSNKDRVRSLGLLRNLRSAKIAAIVGDK